MRHLRGLDEDSRACGRFSRSMVLFISSMAVGGAQRAVAVLANAWIERGWRVSILTFEDGSSDHYALHPQIERVSMNLLWTSRNTFERVRSTVVRAQRIRQEVLKRKPTIVLSFLEQTNVRVLGALAGSGFPVIVSEQIDPRRYNPGAPWRHLRRVLYPRAAAIVVLTEAVRRDWALSHFERDRVHVIPNPLYDLPPPRAAQDACKTILAMGRLDRQKGFDLLLRAFARSGLPKLGWRLRILGEGNERPNLERLTSDLAISDHVEMPGVVVAPDQHMRQGEIFAFSSRYEGFGNALLEAMGMGMAVVSFDCDSGPAELIRHDENGVLLPPEDVPALARALAELANDPGRRQRLGTQALEVREHYNTRTILDRWDSMIARITSSPLGQYVR